MLRGAPPYPCLRYTAGRFRRRKKPGRVGRAYRRVLVWSQRNLPPGLGLVVGLVLIIGGLFGILPVLGFWMIPLGIAVAADVAVVWRWLRKWWKSCMFYRLWPGKDEYFCHKKNREK